MLLLRLVIKMLLYRLLTHFGSVIQRFGSCFVCVCVYFFFSSLNSFGFTMVQRGESGVGFFLAR